MASNDETGTTVEAAEGSSSQRGSGVTSTRAGEKSSGSSGGSPDPDQLVQEIEATREDLAETLDAIVDKVSPRRVMDRTKEQARSDAQDALQTVKESAASAAHTVKVAAASAAETVKEQVASAKETVREKVGGSESQSATLTAGSTASSRRLSGSASVGTEPEDQPLPGSTLAGAPPLTGSPLPDDTVSLSAYDVGSAPDDTSSGAAGTAVVPTAFPAPVLPPAVSSKAPLVAGAGAAVAVLLLLLRRRRR